MPVASSIAAIKELIAYWEPWKQKVLCYRVRTFVSNRLSTTTSRT